MPEDPTEPVDALMPRNDLDWTDPAVRAYGVLAAQAASSLLNERKGGAYPGLCSTRAHVCRRPCPCPDAGLAVARPASGAATWLNCGACGCGESTRLRLPYQPVVEVAEVVVGGQVVDPSAYSVRGNEYVLRCDGLGWPLCPAPCDVDGFVVEWSHGVSPPTEGRLAACALTLELVKSLLGHKSVLPSGATSTTRQGVSVTRGVADALAAGRTNILAVDLFLAPTRQAPTVVLPEDVSPRSGEQGYARW